MGCSRGIKGDQLDLARRGERRAGEHDEDEWTEWDGGEWDEGAEGLGIEDVIDGQVLFVEGFHFRWSFIEHLPVLPVNRIPLS